MNEDKAKITKALLPVLQMTRNLYDLVDLEYMQPGPDEEYVIATFNNGSTKKVNVHMDCGTALILDVVHWIVYNNPPFIQQNGDSNTILPNYGTVNLTIGGKKGEDGLLRSGRISHTDFCELLKRAYEQRPKED